MYYGDFLSVDGDGTRARLLHEEMLQGARSIGDDNQRAEVHYDLALDALAAGDPGTAQPHLAVGPSLPEHRPPRRCGPLPRRAERAGPLRQLVNFQVKRLSPLTA
jgi:hypothetical protein